MYADVVLLALVCAKLISMSNSRTVPEIATDTDNFPFNCGKGVCRSPLQYCRYEAHNTPVCAYCSKDICQSIEPPRQCEAQCQRLLSTKTGPPVKTTETSPPILVIVAACTVSTLFVIVLVIFSLYCHRHYHQISPEDIKIETTRLTGTSSVVSVQPMSDDAGEVLMSIEHNAANP